ncbi:MAG: hypothetical protein OJF47_000132 [Nitrospira sp.]|jgi:glycosyltransferase involved in cell wall biosynthesis|nr:MAG: hypothetical protein OJF47_000132 [Nitrospira sp.]
MPRVSIVIPTYNCEGFLGQAIDSALGQTYRDFELIVVDDGSTDGTRSLVAGYGDAVRYLYQPNQGVSAARNLALSQAGGEFIAYLDADDLWGPEKLVRQVEYLESHPTCGFVHTEIAVIDEQEKVLHARFNHDTGRIVPQGRCVRDVLSRSHIQTLTVLERRDAFNDAGAFDLRLSVAEDYLHWILIVLRGYEVGYLSEPLGSYRWRAGSLMSGRRRILSNFVQMYDILLNEHDLERVHGREMAEVVKEQLFKTQRQLAYVERLEVSSAVARHRLRTLIRQWPLQLELYMDLAKTYLLRN